ncbi:MAG: hypothetical protein WBB07_27080 [Mycobacterium sp.]
MAWVIDDPDLFPEAVTADDHKARWNTDMEIEIDADQSEESIDSMPSWASLNLDLSDSDLASVRDRLSA